MTTPTIVLVHGAWHGGWCWTNVEQQLATEGYEVVAVDLPGHTTPGSSKRKWNTMGSYVTYVDSVVEGIDGEVVLVGHSMGGLVTQRVLETRSVAAAVLVASVPLKGVAGVVWRLLRRDPRQLLETLPLSLWALVANDQRVRENFFSAETEHAVVESTGAKLENESYLAFFSMLGRWPRPTAVASAQPISVVIAQHDGIFTLAEQLKLAAAYDAPTLTIDAGHDMMLEAAWPELANHISAKAQMVSVTI